ncbi:MAG: FAD-dependent oxidoreductase, partial [Gemmatimonadetes bacterium]|nr:FAD-dependent oxidoreductase [Gemmatimonadota bacterium]
MRRNPGALAGREFDLVVVGGGIFGVCAAWDATLRGLSVALLEKTDFAHATSANSYKMIHGGIRYLQHGDVVRLRESSGERRALLRIAPHLVHPLPIVIPTYGHAFQGKELLAAGMLAYDLLTLDRNRGIGAANRRIPRTRLLPREEVLRLFPGLEPRGLTGGAVFHDGQMYNPPRLGLAFVRSAVEGGAVAANYVEAAAFLGGDSRVTGVR